MSKTYTEIFRELKEDTYFYTSLKRIREIAKSYSGRHRVPIKVSLKAFKDEDGGWGGGRSDALLVPLGKGKYVIYLHPLMQFLKERDIRNSIEHELRHLAVERDELRRTKNWVEIMGKPRKE